MKDFRNRSLEFDDILLILLFAAIMAVLGWTAWTTYRSLPEPEPAESICSTPVVAPTNQGTATNNTGKNSFESEEYIWEKW